jgi:hypothetical protein
MITLSIPYEIDAVGKTCGNCFYQLQQIIEPHVICCTLFGKSNKTSRAKICPVLNVVNGEVQRCEECLAAEQHEPLTEEEHQKKWGTYGIGQRDTSNY